MSRGPAQRIEPGPGQESVWDYPRPPKLEPVPETIRIEVGGVTLVDTGAAYRVLETSHPPVYYIPQADIRMEFMAATDRTSYCEWKGSALYYDVVLDRRRVESAAWSYPKPTGRFEPIADHLAFYVHLMDACYVGDERARPQAGGFYGGWITDKVVGPFKGEPGTWGW